MNAPSDSKIGELLAKLQELDLGTYLRIEAYDIFQDDDPRRQWTIQGVIQDAIAARGWYWKVCSSQYLTQFVSRVGPMTNIREAQRDAPAEALLAAYVAALEAEAQG